MVRHLRCRFPHRLHVICVTDCARRRWMGDVKKCAGRDAGWRGRSWVEAALNMGELRSGDRAGAVRGRIP